MIHTFKDLLVWQKAVTFSIAIYELTASFPKEELYGLSSQLKRASVSVPSNIAEGRNRGTRKDFCQFLKIALGSCAELQTQLEIAMRLGFVPQGQAQKLEQSLVEIIKMINAMIKKLKADS
jgi:four helix bundle protein